MKLLVNKSKTRWQELHLNRWSVESENCKNRRIMWRRLNANWNKFTAVLLLAVCGWNEMHYCTDSCAQRSFKLSRNVRFLAKYLQTMTDCNVLWKNFVWGVLERFLAFWVCLWMKHFLAWWLWSSIETPLPQFGWKLMAILSAGAIWFDGIYKVSVRHALYIG